MRALAAVVAAVAVLAAAPVHAGAPDSGIRGKVTISGSCGPIGPDDPAPRPQPLDAEVEIRRPASGELVRKVRSGEDGLYRVRLRPGRYLVVPGAAYGGGGIAFSKDRARVRVAEDGFRRVTLRYDNGCR